MGRLECKVAGEGSDEMVFKSDHLVYKKDPGLAHKIV
jgi:hypothetical protein